MIEAQKIEASKLWAQGMKTRDIAAVFRVTKSNMAYIAASNRHLFPARSATYYRASGFSAKNIEDRAKSKGSIKPKWPEKAPGHDGVPVGRLTSCGCVFPLWGHHEKFTVESSLYCGADRDGTHNYCTFHRKVAA